jgi:hypothetical protein
MGFSLKDIPIIGEPLYEARQAIHGNPDAVKAAYDTQIAATKEQSKEMRDFLMAQKGQAQAFYGPLAHMFRASYGTDGIQAPQVPQAVGPLAQMYGGK